MVNTISERQYVVALTEPAECTNCRNREAKHVALRIIQTSTFFVNTGRAGAACIRCPVCHYGGEWVPRSMVKRNTERLSEIEDSVFDFVCSFPSPADYLTWHWESLKTVNVFKIVKDVRSLRWDRVEALVTLGAAEIFAADPRRKFEGV